MKLRIFPAPRLNSEQNEKLKMKNSKSSSLLRLLRFSFQLSAFSFLFAASAHAATAIWDGATNTNWNADNWSGGGGAGGAPVANDILRFSGNGGTGGPATVNDFGALTQFGNGTGDAIQFTNNGTGGVTNTAFSLSGNSITLGGGITATSSTAAIQDTISNDLVIGAFRSVASAGNHTIALTGNITLNVANATLNFNNAATLSGAGGAINLSATNAAITYNNATTASSLTLSRTINATAGAFLNNNSIDPAATVIYNGTFNGSANTFVLAGTNVGANDFQSAIGNAGNATILLKSGTGSWTVSGLMSSIGQGVSGVTGNLTLSNNNNSYTGSTLVTAGTLNIATIADYGTASAVGKGTSGTALRLGNNDTSGILNYTGTGSSSNRTIQIGAGTVNTHTGNATIQNNGSNGGTGLKFTATAFNPTIASTNANRTLTLGGTNTDANEIQGVIQNNTAITGLVAVTKAGAGRWILSGNNTYSGGTSVSTGTLLVSNSTGSGLGTGDVTVSGGTLGGSGSFTGGVTVNAGGTLAPGSSIESLGAGNVTLTAGTFAFEINTSTPTADLLFASDANVALTLTSGVPTLTITDLGSNVALADGTKFTLISYNTAGGWNNGIFSGYVNNSEFTLGANKWQINYADAAAGSNFQSDAELFGDRFVTITVVPEPTTWALLAFSLTTVMVLRRRRNS